MSASGRSAVPAALTRLPEWSRLLGTSVLWALALFLSGKLGALTRLESSSFALIWPPVGVVALWALSSTARSRPFDVVLLLLGLTAMNWSFGPLIIAAGTAGYLAEAAALIWIFQRWLPEFHPGGMSKPSSLRELGYVFVASVVGGFLQSLLLDIGLSWAGEVEFLSDFMLRWWRNVATLFVVMTCVSVFTPRLRSWWRGETPVRRRTRAERQWFRRLVIAHLVATITLLVAMEFFPTMPLSFLFLLPTAFAGLRLGMEAATALGLFTGVSVLIVTLVGVGEYAVMESLAEQSVIAQVFVTVSVAVAVIGSILQQELHDERQSNANQATELICLIAELDEGLTVIDEFGEIGIFNPAMVNILGRSLGPDFTAMTESGSGFMRLDGTPLPAEEMPHRRALEGLAITGERILMKLPEWEESRVLSINAAPLPQFNPADPRRVVITVRDVTAEHRQFDAMASFAGVVAHDLKSPLAVIEGWSEALGGEFEEGLVHDKIGAPMVTRIGEAAARMRNFINDLLTYTMSKEQVLRPEHLELNAMVDDIASVKRDAAPSGAVPVVEHGDLDAVYGDRLLIRQVLDNIIGNAVKYVEEGVVPHVRVSTRILDSGFVEVRVSDNGIGIPEEQRARVFESFHRANRSGGYSGTGLGLSICEQIIKRHNGEISVHAGPDGLGSEFRFTLPLGQHQQELASAA